MNTPVRLPPPGSPARRTLCRRALASLDEPLAVAHETFERVRADGDAGLKALCQRFEGSAPETLFVPEAEIAAAHARLPPDLARALRDASAAIERFATSQRPEAMRVETRPGIVCETRFVAVDRVGLYVPGGRAPLVSTLLMLAIPARVAGCSERMVITPRGKDGHVDATVLAAAHLLGIGRVLQVGGAQGIAAAALGTDAVPRVDKLFGPGNRFVTAAKLVASLPPVNVAIDAVAGPSELLVVADASADTRTVLADLASQVEHGEDSEVMLVTVGAAASARFAHCEVLSGKQYKWLEAPDRESAFAFVNEYAPEHLSLQLEQPEAALPLVRHAGAVFVGGSASVVFGDYAAGTNHTLPTHGTARGRGALSTLDFMKPMLVMHAPNGTPHDLIDTTERLALAEGLSAHAAAAAERRR